MTGTEIYQRTAAYERDISTIRLHAPQWKLLLAYDGQRTLAEVALSVDVPFAEALPLTEKFLERKWIEEQPITLDQYLKRTGISTTSPPGAAVPPVVVLHSPKPESAETPAPPVAEKVVMPPPKPQPVPVPVAKTPRGPMKLAAVVDSIISTVGNRSLGQLLVYRVFLRVSPELLLSEDISTIHMVNDPSLIRSAELQRAITNAVQEIVKRPLPESVYAAA